MGSFNDAYLLGMISYVLINLCCGQIKKSPVVTGILAVLFILKYIFI